MASISEEILADAAALRAACELLEDERSLPTRQVVDIILDWRQEDPGHQAVADYVLWKIHPQVSAGRVYITWVEVDTALSDLEEDYETDLVDDLGDPDVDPEPEGVA